VAEFFAANALQSVRQDATAKEGMDLASLRADRGTGERPAKLAADAKREIV
jgi:hypothetical protein